MGLNKINKGYGFSYQRETKILAYMIERIPQNKVKHPARIANVEAGRKA